VAKDPREDMKPAKGTERKGHPRKTSTGFKKHFSDKDRDEVLQKRQEIRERLAG
jgi:hypothetical protein